MHIRSFFIHIYAPNIHTPRSAFHLQLYTLHRYTFTHTHIGLHVYTLPTLTTVFRHIHGPSVDVNAICFIWQSVLFSAGSPNVRTPSADIDLQDALQDASNLKHCPLMLPKMTLRWNDPFHTML
jgi:hypothetical protein